MSLDPYIPPDPEIQALLKVTGVRAWKLWAPSKMPGKVYLTLQIGNHGVSGKIAHDAPPETWRISLATLLDRIKLLEAA